MLPGAMYPDLLADLVIDLPHAVRLQRLVSALRMHFRCGAVALLRLEEDHLRPVAVDGLVRDALGRRFAVGLHPRLAAILARRGVTCFHHDSMLPDPYDGLIDEHVGEPLPVHDCMGTRLEVDGQPWGVLTLDALTVGTFDGAAQAELQRLTVIVEAAVRTTRLEGEIRALQLARGTPESEEGTAPHDIGAEIIGQSEAIANLLHELEVVADTDLPVLLLGETGVGKELFAHRLHRQSRRRAQPLVHVNCAALPESLAESELFGHARGAFSGATGERPGRFEAADGGTLFLDEVGELPLAIQAKLLRTLQNGEIQRLGSDRPRRVNVRVIAATNRNLREHVRDGSFRADLYHRLSVYPIPIPPLRERGNDVLLLAGRFLELNRARLGLRSLRLSGGAQDALRHYRWPGNVRELEHVISRAALRAVSRGAGRNDIVTLEPELLDLDGLELPPAAQAGTGAASAPAMPAPAAGIPLRDAVEHTQRACIAQALRDHGGNWAQAARQLGIDASNLHKLARRLGCK
ncbi:nitric oxide reductase transcriptional regulator NorR [Cupriavidus taiwanensis]|uniref:Transcriptional regulator of anaerobic NO reduction and detoxification (EBP family Sigma-54 interaction domain) n=1 Tax=Cupriavidus taiwanensis TaxID=164546 RepID=A0A375J768_9BURK|nr:transcriptional regulator of anaerobic NO reduction and detoxification (EBP family; Sigma-54 interaction domain [Cupriavidus taiwanensis]